jgi:hypothetical protein
MINLVKCGGCLIGEIGISHGSCHTKNFSHPAKQSHRDIATSYTPSFVQPWPGLLPPRDHGAVENKDVPSDVEPRDHRDCKNQLLQQRHVRVQDGHEERAERPEDADSTGYRYRGTMCIADTLKVREIDPREEQADTSGGCHYSCVEDTPVE